jgi:hypothetical protein
MEEQQEAVMTKEEKSDQLLKEFKKQRDEIIKMVEEMEILKANISKLFPERMDSRYSHLFEEKVKTMSAFFNVLLDMRKEIIKSLKDEFELRKKVDTGELKEEELEGILDIRKITDKINTFNKKRNKLQKERMDAVEDVDLEKEGIKIPGINAPV